MSFVNLGFLGSAVMTLTGLLLIIIKMLEDDTKNMSFRLALFCWSSISFIVFFILGTQHVQSPTERQIFAYYGNPILIGAAIFIASIPVLMWLEEHGWKDKTLCRLVFTILCLAVIVPFIFYKFLN